MQMVIRFCTNSVGRLSIPLTESNAGSIYCMTQWVGPEINGYAFLVTAHSHQLRLLMTLLANCDLMTNGVPNPCNSLTTIWRSHLARSPVPGTMQHIHDHIQTAPGEGIITLWRFAGSYPLAIRYTGKPGKPHFCSHVHNLGRLASEIDRNVVLEPYREVKHRSIQFHCTNNQSRLRLQDRRTLLDTRKPSTEL